MKLVKTTKYRLSMNTDASQIILVCHGGWSTSDGKVSIPKHMVVNFYSAHGQFGTQSISLAEQMLGAQSNVALSGEVIAQIKIMMDGGLTYEEASSVFKKSNGTADDVQVYETANRVVDKKIYNYSLSYSGPRGNEGSVEKLFAQHQTGNLDSDFDLMIMNLSQTGHLKSALKLATSNGNYGVFHFMPCRYVDKDDVASMKTVDLPTDFDGEDFMVTNLLH